MFLQRMQILVTPEQRDWLDRESARRGLASTAIIRDALDAARGVRPAGVRLAAVARLASMTVAPEVTQAEIDASLASRYPAVPS